MFFLEAERSERGRGMVGRNRGLQLLPRMGEHHRRSPDLRLLTKYYDCYDMHLHSDFSDGRASVGEIVDRAEQLDIGIAVTDHNEIRGSLKAIRMSRCPVVPAIEVSSRQGKDVLVYFMKAGDLERFYVRSVEPYRGTNPNSFTTIQLMDILESAVAHGGFSVLAHPYGWGWKSYAVFLRENEERLKDLTVGVECCNGTIARWRNKRGYRLAKNWAHALIGGSDSHIVETIGDVVTCIEKNPGMHPIDVILEKSSAVVGTRSQFVHRMKTNWSVSMRHLRWWPSIARNGIWGDS